MRVSKRAAAMSPCKNCKSRSAECHGKCVKYATYLMSIKLNKGGGYVKYYEH